MKQEKEIRMKADQKEWFELDAIEIISAIWKNKFKIFFSAMTLALIFYLLSSLFMQKQFQSNTQIYVVNRQNSDTTVTYTDLQSGNYLIQDYKELIVSEPVLQQVIVDLKLPITHEILKKKINIQTPSDTRVLQIIVTDPDPYAARDIANAVRKAAATHISNVMDIDAVNVVKYANIPIGPASPNTIKYGLLGGVIGGMLLLVIVVLIEIMDDTIKSPDDIEIYLGLSYIGSVPLGKNGVLEKATKGKFSKRRKEKGRKRRRR